jgi:hypothetical protein
MIKCSKAQAAIMLAPQRRSLGLAITTRSVGDAINQGKTPAHSEGNKATKAPEPASWQSIKMILVGRNGWKLARQRLLN